MKGTTKHRATSIKLAGFFVVSAIVSTYLAVVLGNISLADTDDYHAVFADVSGLKSGSPVRIAGVDVGEVNSVSIYRGDRVRVDFDVESSVRLSTETHATVRYKNLIGDRYLELSGGRSGARLKPGGTIRASRTSPALDLDTLLNGFKPLFTGLAPRQINAVSQELVAVFQGESGTMSSLLSTVASLTGTLADRDALIGAVIDNLDATLHTVSQNRSAVDTLIVQLQQLISGLSAERGPIGDALVHLDGLSRSAAALLTIVRPDLRVDVRKLGRLATTLNQSSDTLTTVLDRLPHTYRVLARLGAYGNFFNFYVCSSRFRITMPDGSVVFTPKQMNKAARCK